MNGEGSRVKLNLNLIKAELPSLREMIRSSQIDETLLSKMLLGWQNEARAHPQYCLGILRELCTLRPKHILECGSGFTTILLSVAAEELQSSLHVLEDSELWADITRRSLRFLGLQENVVKTSPLINYGDFDWYSIPNVDDLHFDCVICDGPPGPTRGGRVGLLPVLDKSLSTSCIVLLDDAGREGEGEVLEIWKRKFEMKFEILGEEHHYARVSRL